MIHVAITFLNLKQMAFLTYLVVEEILLFVALLLGEEVNLEVGVEFCVMEILSLHMMD